MKNLLLSTRDLIHRESRIPFFKEIDLYSIEEDLLIGVSGALAKGFRFEGRDLLLQSEIEIEDFERRLRKFLNSLPEGAILHFLVRAQSGDEDLLEKYLHSVTERNALSSRLIQNKVEFYQTHPFLKREIFLFVVLHPVTKKFHSSFFPNLSLAVSKKARALSGEEYGKSKDSLLILAEEVKEGFRNLGFSLTALKEDEIFKYLYEVLNPAYSKEIPVELAKIKAFQPSASLRSSLLFSSAMAGERFLYLGDHFHKGVNLYQPPQETDLKVMKDFEGLLGKDYLLSITVQVADQEKEKAFIKREGNFSKAGAFFSRTKEHDALEKAGESDEFLTELAATGDRLFLVWFAAIVKGRTQEEAGTRAREVLRAFPRLGDARAIEDHMNHDRLFLSSLPLQGDDNPIPHLIRSEALSHLLPLQASWKGTQRPGVLFKTYRDEPLPLDLFDPALAAKHAVMLGSTGSGKSFFTNHLLLYFLAESPTHQVIIIDVGGSYKKLARLFGGAYLEVECSEEYALNPFPRKETLFPESKEADATFLQFLKELLQKMIDSKKTWSSSEKMILERAIREVYGPLKKEDAPILGDIEKKLRGLSFGDEADKQKAYQFAKELVLFTEGEYGKILNRKGNFDFDSRFTVFDLRKISHYPELQEIFLLIIPFALKRKFENVHLKKLLVLDECWQLLKQAQGSELVEVFYRTARKMNAGVLSITQNPEDFLEAAVASSIINNSPVKYILRLKKSRERLSQFGLNENEIRATGELEVRPGFYSETFIKFDQRATIVKLEPSPLEYWIATTDPTDVSEELRTRESNPALPDFELLEKLAAKFPNGVRKGESLNAA